MSSRREVAGLFKKLPFKHTNRRTTPINNNDDSNIKYNDELNGIDEDNENDEMSYDSLNLISPRLTEEQESPKTTSVLPSSTTEHFILSGLVESEFIYGYMNKVFERKQEDMFLEKLEKIVENEGREIQDLCSNHYEEFLTSVSRLHSVRDNASQLKARIINLNEELQEAGERTLNYGNRLLQSYNKAENIRTALDTAKSCQHVAELQNKALKQIDNHEYYSALKTLDTLHKSLRTIGSSDYALYLERSIPILKHKVKQSVHQSFTEWLQTVRDLSKNIGETVLELVSNEMSKEFSSLFSNSRSSEGAGMGSIWRRAVENSNVELSPVLTARHIYETLNNIDEFRLAYQRERNAQIKRDLDAKPGKRRNSISVKEYICKIAGFFAVEGCVRHAEPCLVSRVEMNVVWESALPHVKEVIQQGLHQCNNANETKELKNSVEWFSVAQEAGGLHGAPLRKLI
eukprot:gb/GECH01014531.1/.p1 GENE.gb/GECH01014531.1/~~gb/GECH01014531.1/.p1  ORF type:complete len:459 (+),score=138.35 gb/GECH01014531.1/:1-1377(+)